ncbi:MAG: hypothetical protein ABW201_12905 [Candidatus Thiodiazotropha sp.]
MSILTTHLIDEAGYVSPRAVAEEFHTTVKEVAVLSGLSPDTVSKQSRFRSKLTLPRKKKTSLSNRDEVARIVRIDSYEKHRKVHCWPLQVGELFGRFASSRDRK